MSHFVKRSASVMLVGLVGVAWSRRLFRSGWPIDAAAAERRLPRQVVRGVERPLGRMEHRDAARRGDGPQRHR